MSDVGAFEAKQGADWPIMLWTLHRHTFKLLLLQSQQDLIYCFNVSVKDFQNSPQKVIEGIFKVDYFCRGHAVYVREQEGQQVKV